MFTFKINIKLLVWHFLTNFLPITSVGKITVPIFTAEFFEAQERIKSDQISVI